MDEKRLISWLLLINYWRMSQGMSMKGQKGKETIYIGYKMVSILVCLYGWWRLGKSLCIDNDQARSMKNEYQQ